MTMSGMITPKLAPIFLSSMLGVLKANKSIDKNPPKPRTTITPEEIDPEEPLFGDGLGLDSIDALEMALAISQKYGVQLRSEDEHVKETFSTLRTLNRFILDNSPAQTA